MSLKRGRDATRPNAGIPAGSIRAAGGLARGEQLAQEVVQDAAVAEVVDLVEGVDAAGEGDLLARRPGGRSCSDAVGRVVRSVIPRLDK